LSTEEVVKSAFDAADESHDGALSAAELALLCLALGSTLEPQEVEAALQTLDTDGNGKIEYEEFIKWWKGEGAKGFLY
jgi:Ca2+-binding EF-hand superfamily protein